VFFQGGPEVEFGFAKTEWCAVEGVRFPV
jgi:hypothetical protein